MLNGFAAFFRKPPKNAALRNKKFAGKKYVEILRFMCYCECAGRIMRKTSRDLILSCLFFYVKKNFYIFFFVFFSKFLPKKIYTYVSKIFFYNFFLTIFLGGKTFFIKKVFPPNPLFKKI